MPILDPNELVNTIYGPVLRQRPIIQANHIPFYTVFVNTTLQKAEDSGIKVKFLSQSVVYNGSKAGVAGYFTEKELAVCTQGHDVASLMMQFVHESCHMDQYIDDKELWNQCDSGYTKYFRWLNKEIELSKEKIEQYTNDVITLELDCERRSVEKIKRFNLPINIKNYIRAANTYLFSILYASHKRTWYKDLPSTVSVVTKASSRFKSDYTKIPGKLLKAFNESPL